MVCNRCIFAVQHIFDEHQVELSQLILGEAHTKTTPDSETLMSIKQHLQNIGFEVIEDSSSQLIEKIKKQIILKISDLDIEENFSLSAFLSNHFNKDYSSLSKIFSQLENTTLEHYFIHQKIEKAKELLVYNELNLTEISIHLGYKSVQHLSSQFKNTTGFSPSEFKKLKSKLRKPIDLV